jgi:hypothetical protein
MINNDYAGRRVKGSGLQHRPVHISEGDVSSLWIRSRCYSDETFRLRCACSEVSWARQPLGDAVVKPTLTGLRLENASLQAVAVAASGRVTVGRFPDCFSLTCKLLVRQTIREGCYGT